MSLFLITLYVLKINGMMVPLWVWVFGWVGLVLKGLGTTVKVIHESDWN